MKGADMLGVDLLILGGIEIVWFRFVYTGLPVFESALELGKNISVLTHMTRRIHTPVAARAMTGIGIGLNFALYSPRPSEVGRRNHTLMTIVASAEFPYAPRR